MTGTDIKKIRKALDVDQYALAKIIGVHASTVMRWEAHTAWSGNPLHEQILEALKRWLAKHNAATGRSLGIDLRIRLANYNALSALRFLLQRVA